MIPLRIETVDTSWVPSPEVTMSIISDGMREVELIAQCNENLQQALVYGMIIGAFVGMLGFYIGMYYYGRKNQHE